MSKPEKISVIIKVPVAVAGKHYQPSDKPVSLGADDAQFLLVRGKAVEAAKKADK